MQYSSEKTSMEKYLKGRIKTPVRKYMKLTFSSGCFQDKLPELSHSSLFIHASRKFAGMHPTSPTYGVHTGRDLF